MRCRKALQAPAAAQRALSPSSAGGYLNRRRAVGQVHRVGHRDEHFARSLEALPAVRGADVVHKHATARVRRFPTWPYYPLDALPPNWSTAYRAHTIVPKVSACRGLSLFIDYSGTQ